MGKRRGKKKKRVQSDRHRRRGHESGPEATGASHDNATGSCSPAWNSLDEESLRDYAQNAAAGESGEEVEVAELLSYLNFSVIPCALEPRHLECEPHAQGLPTDVDLLSELTSATHHEREDSADARKRESRKRASRRRPNKRAKKLRSASAGDFMCLCEFVREGSAPSTLRGATDMASVKGCERCWEPVSGRGKTRRRSRGERFDPLAHNTGRWGQGGRGRLAPNRSESTTPVNLPSASMALQCLVDMECENGGLTFSTDTSPTGEVDMGAEPEDSDHTPPAVPAPMTPADLYEVVEREEEESELSDTTSDSGCDGDDEESSVERVNSVLPGWWEREPLFVSSNDDSDSDQEKFANILNGAIPHMTAPESRATDTPRSLKKRLSLSEFKHPGKFGIRGNARKKRFKPAQTGDDLTPAEVNSKIADFVRDQSERELKFVLVSRAHRRTISHLAVAYRLHCEVEQQKRRLPVASPRLTKTSSTRLAGWEEVEPILKSHNAAGLVLPFSHSHTMEVVPHGVGTVGEAVPALDETNIGNRMLRGMGWRPGMGLGPEGDGMREPVTAHIRHHRSGLGF